LLDIDLLRSELSARSHVIAESFRHTSGGLSVALGCMRDEPLDLETMKSSLKLKGEDSYALPADNHPEAPKSIPGFTKDQAWAERALQDQFVASVDGSQIYPEGHLRFNCALVNMGSARFHYTSPVEYLGVSKPYLLVGDDLVVTQGSFQRLISKEDLDRTRLEMEVKHASEILESAKPKESFLFIDGPLIYSFLDPRSDISKRRIVGLLVQLLELCDQRRVYLSGYLAASRAADWTNSLRYSILCDRIPNKCDNCISECKGIRNTACYPLIGLTDSTLFNAILKPGERSSVFTVQRKILDHYRSNSADYRESISAFYLKLGHDEVARIEIPYYDWMNEEDIQRVHRITLAQMILGFGYPYVLTRAHEKAIITAPEKNGFYDVLDRFLASRFGSDLHESAKRKMKRESVI
jgi:hypothetical protein